MKAMFNKIVKHCLALFIRYPKRPRTKGDVLRYALKHYLKQGERGLCYEISMALEHYEIFDDLNNYSYESLSEYFHLFRHDIAIRRFNGLNHPYWWPIEDWRNRYRYMRWLIKEYDKEVL